LIKSFLNFSLRSSSKVILRALWRSILPVFLNF